MSIIASIYHKLNPSNVDGIMKTFTSTIDKLEAARDHHLNQADLHQDVIDTMQKRKDAASAEAIRAHGLAAKLRNVFK
jgi:hypothetical protein